MKEYEKELVEYCDRDISYFEIKRKVEKEGNTSAKCLVVCAVESIAEEINSKLCLLANNKMDALSYYSFISRTSEQRNKAIACNRLQNVKMKCKVIKNTHVKEMVKMHGVEMSMRKELGRIEVNKEITFQVVEQRFGHKSNDVFAYYHPEHKQLARK